MQAIRTKYLGPTNQRGSRIRAQCEAKSITVPYDHALNIEQNHRAAAIRLARAMGWDGPWSAGCLSDGSWAHVNVEWSGVHVITPGEKIK